jgi:ligand-binding SRPBCC domain-containing protein
MLLYYLEREQWIPRPIAEVFSFFSRPENLQAITPSWLDFRVTEAPSQLEAGALIRYQLRWRKLPMRWTTEITLWNPPFRFADRQLSGPYALWNHEHSFLVREGGTLMRDSVTYAVPGGIFAPWIQAFSVKRDVERIFDFRAEAMRKIFPPSPDAAD